MSRHREPDTVPLLLLAAVVVISLAIGAVVVASDLLDRAAVLVAGMIR